MPDVPFGRARNRPRRPGEPSDRHARTSNPPVLPGVEVLRLLECREALDKMLSPLFRAQRALQAERDPSGECAYRGCARIGSRFGALPSYGVACCSVHLLWSAASLPCPRPGRASYWIRLAYRKWSHRGAAIVLA